MSTSPPEVAEPAFEPSPQKPKRFIDEIPVSRVYEDRRSVPRESEDRRKRRRMGEEEVVSDWMSDRLDTSQPVAAPEGNRRSDRQCGSHLHLAGAPDEIPIVRSRLAGWPRR